MKKSTKKLAYIFAWALVVPAFVVSQLSYWKPFLVNAQTIDPTEIEEKKDDIKDIQKEIDKKLEKKEKLETNLNQLQSAVSSTQRVITSTQSKLKETQETISRKEAEVKTLTEKINFERELLKGIMQDVYIEKKQPLIAVVLKDGNLAEILSGVDHRMTVEERMSALMQDILETKDAIADEMDELASMKEDHEDLLEEKVDQKIELVAAKNETAEDIAQVDASIDELKQKLAEVQSDLNKILGKNYNAKDVKDAIRFASAQTGVREGFLFGMLSVESRLGASVGGCDYKQSRMNAARLVIFKDIANELGYDYRKLKVSCPPRSYRGTGGAMGAAQFMSDTWKGYKSRIASNTGHNPPDPWNLTDGVMAMALKVQNDGGAKDGKTTITSPCTKKKITVKYEDVAALRYLGWSCYGLTYAKNIQSLAANYKQL